MLSYESNGKEIIVRGRSEDGGRYQYKRPFTPYFYVPSKDGEHTSLFGDKLKKVECDSTFDLVNERKRYKVTFESDVPHANKFLIDNFKEIKPEPIRVCFLDIETEDRDGFPDVEIADKQILSIALYDSFTKKYFALVTSPNKKSVRGNYNIEYDGKDSVNVEYLEYKTENEMLAAFIKIVINFDFDIFYAWNGEGFDYPMIFNRINRLKLPVKNLSPIKAINPRTKYPRGRAFMDLMKAHRKLSTQEMESYALDYIGEMELGSRKVVHDEKIGDMWEHDMRKFVKYNVKDVYLMVGIEAKKGITDYFDTIRRTTYCNWDDLLWNSKVLDTFALKYAHELDIVLPAKNYGKDDEAGIQGARVLIPEVGIHKGAAVLDVTSLYPSAILTCNMSPETIIDENYAIEHSIQYCKVDDICFRVDKRGFVPLLVERLWGLRQDYKKIRNQYDMDSLEYEKWDTTQSVCKFLLNSIYGVLLLKVFRLYCRDVGKSITYFGREYNIHMEGLIRGDGYTPMYGDSVVGNTKIDIVGKGRINIEDLFTHVCYKKGDKEYCKLNNVLTPTIDDDGNHVMKRVPYVMRHKTDKQMYRVNLVNNTFVDVTEDHSLIGLRTGNKRSFKDRLINISPKDVENTNMRNITCICQNIFEDEEYPNNNIPEEVYGFIGYYLGDGSLHKKTDGGLRKVITFSVAKNDKDSFIESYIKPNVENGYIKTYNVYDHDTYFVIDITGKITEFAIENFQKDRSKWFNYDHVERLNIEQIKYFLNGLFDSDGSVSFNKSNKRYQITYCSVNTEWCEFVVQLLKHVKIASNWRINKKLNDNSGFKANFILYQVSVKDNERFRQEVGFKLRRKHDILNDNTINTKYNYDNYYMSSIKTIEKIDYDGYVYDIEVEDTHRFFANNILVHNTDSIAFQLHETGFEERIKEANAMNDKINSLNDKWCEDRWGTSKYNKLNLEMEQIYETLLNFPSRTGKAAKKKYCGLVYYKDGVDLRDAPELCIKGISAKRSDSPSILRNLQKEVFIMVLNGQYDEARARIKKVRFDITNGKFTPEELAFPKGMSKNIDEYTKTTPIHIRGAKYANLFCNENIKREKIKFIYVKDCVHPRCTPPTNVISFMEHFPEGYSPDWVKMAEKLIDYQYDTLYKCMGWDINELKGQISLAAFM